MTGNTLRRNHLLATVCLGSALLVGVSLSGCADGGARATGLADEFGVANGQRVLFVGTDPQTLQTEVYVVSAVGDGDVPPDIAEANQFAVEAITTLGAADAANGAVPPLSTEGDNLFSTDAPFAVPDREGRHVAVLATPDPDASFIGPGRVGLVRAADHALAVGPDVEGLFGAHFTWTGSYLVLAHWDPNQTDVPRLVSVPVAGFDGFGPELEVLPLQPEAEAAGLRFVGHVRGGDSFVALARDSETGRSDAWLLDAATGQARILSENLVDPVDSPTVSPDGRWLAATTTSPVDGVRTLHVLDLSTKGPPALVWSTALGDDSGGEPQSGCYWPVWSPDGLTDMDARLAYVCQDLISERPDLSLWSPPGDMEVLTDVPQPAVFDGTMDGLVVRSRPQWDPTGTYLVFGASTWETAFEGGGMTLFVLPIGETAYPVYSGDEGSVGWAHFSAASATPSLLVWDRNQSGLQDAQGGYPILVVATDQANPSPRGVALGRNLQVSYPLFLGLNSMLYP